MSKSSARSPQHAIKLSQLRALAAVAECSNFGEAAFQLGLTQPTVSHAIANLEDELGVVLLIRGRSGAHLTPAGTQILTHAQAILARLDAIVQDANLHKGLHGGIVRIASFRSAAAHLLPKMVAEFTQQYPDIEVDITEYYDYTYVEKEVREGKADIGITLLPAGDGFDSVELLLDPYLVVLPSTWTVASDPISWDELLHLPLILYPDDNSCFLDVQTLCQQAGYRLTPRYQFRETSTILNMVEQGLGASIVPYLSTVAMPEGVRACSLPAPLERKVGAITLSNALHSPAIFACLSVLRVSCSSQEEPGTSSKPN